MFSFDVTRIPKPTKGPLSALLTVVLTVGTYLLAWRAGVNLRLGEWIAAADYTVLTIAGAWTWFWVRSWPEREKGK